MATTTANRLPFSPLTLQGLAELRDEAARLTAVDLTYHDTYGGTLDDDVARALTQARRYRDMLAAAVDRCNADRAVTS